MSCVVVLGSSGVYRTTFFLMGYIEMVNVSHTIILYHIQMIYKDYRLFGNNKSPANSRIESFVVGSQPGKTSGRGVIIYSHMESSCTSFTIQSTDPQPIKLRFWVISDSSTTHYLGLSFSIGYYIYECCKRFSPH